MKIWVLRLLPWVVFSLFGFYLVSTNFSAKLGMIDDHEIAMFLGSDGKIYPSEIPGIIMSTEVGAWGRETRFRPAYYTLRIVESALWRGDAQAWYLCRYILIVVSMVLAFEILTIFFPAIVAYLFIFYVMTMPFWPDILTRLGPSEIYGLPAVLLFFYGMLKNKWWMLILGYLVAVGSKENLVILLPILLTWAVFERERLGRKGWVIVTMLTAYSAWIIGAIVVATGRAQVDFYLNDISYSKRILTTIQMLPSIVNNRHLLGPLIVFAGSAVFTKRKYWLLGSAILVVALSQYVFYNNALPTNSRYDFPAILLFPIFDLVVVKMMLELIPHMIYSKYLKLLIYGGLSLFMLVFVIRRGYTLIHQSADRNAASTIKFDQNVRQAVADAKANPGATLVFNSDHFTDFEPIVSVSRYLSAAGVTNQMVIQYTREPKLNDELGLELERRMTAAMMGEPQIDNTFARFEPLAKLQKPCYTLSFYGAPAWDDCAIVASF